jgi:hypothetical protein
VAADLGSVLPGGRLLIVSKLDRLARSVSHLSRVVETLQQTAGLEAQLAELGKAGAERLSSAAGYSINIPELHGSLI